MRKIFRSMAIGAVVASYGVAAHAADYVILDSTAAGIEPGIVVDGNADIAIPDGAQVVMIDPNGDTLVVDGPFNGPLTSAARSGDQSLGSTLENLTTTRGEDTTVLGAVRAPQVEGGSVTE